ncbi:hypothetical protein ACH5RR_023658 [Cinchona calisaya]|uniref:RING-type domain-containing protein n=1 Tax=Cinchona calisaya TaxID=153742 RepID=A0ABD2ZBA8_9GENT
MDGQLGLIPKLINSIVMATSKIITILIIIALSIYRLIFIKWFHGDQNYHIPSLNFLSNSDNAKKKSVYCTVCLSNIKGDEKCRQLPKCNHCFHVECIDKWFELSRFTCPLCRIEVPHHLYSHDQKHKYLFFNILSFFKAFFRNICGRFDREVRLMLCENIA